MKRVVKYNGKIIMILLFCSFSFLMFGCESDTKPIKENIAIQLSQIDSSFILEPKSFLDYTHIIISAKTIIIPTEQEQKWGQKLLRELNLEGLSNHEKAKTIQQFITENFKYKIRSPRTITDMIDIGGGNCVSHTMMGLFLLRKAGIPAKLCYEFHVKNYSAIDQWRANSAKAGHFGAGHNSHYWLMFFDGNEWQPYDSALDICGLDEFFSVRTKTQKWPYLLSFNPKRMTGAPFIIQEETGSGSTNMKNITKDIWGRAFVWNNKKVNKEEWLLFLKSFEGKNTKDFIYPLEKSIRMSIKKMSKKWF